MSDIASNSASLPRETDSGRGNKVMFVTRAYWTKVQSDIGTVRGGRLMPDLQLAALQ